MSQVHRFVLLVLAGLLASAATLVSIWSTGGSISPLWVIIVLSVAGALYGASQSNVRLADLSDKHVQTVGVFTILAMPVVLWFGLIILRNSDPAMLLLLTLGWLTGGTTILEYGLSTVFT